MNWPAREAGRFYLGFAPNAARGGGAARCKPALPPHRSSNSAEDSLTQRPSGFAATLLSVGVVIVAMISSQAGASIAESLFGRIGPSGAAGLRVAAGAVMLGIAFRPWRSWPTRQAWRPILAYGASVGVMNQMFYNALARIPLGLAVALEFTGPLAVAMAGSRRPLDFVWVVLAVGGLLLILRPGHGGGALDPLGVALALGAGVCWALYIIFGQKAGGEHGLRSTALGMTVAALVSAPYGLVQAGAGLFSLSVILTGVAVGFLGSALPYGLEMIALTRLPRRTFGVLMSLQPAAGALAGFVLLRQRLSLAQWVAIGAVVAASIGATATLGSKSRVLSGEP
jgi:inner membrane transporter RhtA